MSYLEDETSSLTEQQKVQDNANWVWGITQPEVCHVKFKKTHDDAILPRKAHPDPKTGDTGYDLFAVEDTVIPARGSAVVPVGLTLAYMTPGYWFRIEPRSGLGFKHSLQPHLGVIDNPYRGDLGVKLYNFSDNDATIEAGKACAQFALYEIVNSTVSFSDTISKSTRGAEGFGSSDKV